MKDNIANLRFCGIQFYYYNKDDLNFIPEGFKTFKKDKEVINFCKKECRKVERESEYKRLRFKKFKIFPHPYEVARYICRGFYFRYKNGI